MAPKRPETASKELQARAWIESQANERDRTPAVREIVTRWSLRTEVAGALRRDVIAERKARELQSEIGESTSASIDKLVTTLTPTRDAVAEHALAIHRAAVEATTLAMRAQVASAHQVRDEAMEEARAERASRMRYEERALNEARRATHAEAELIRMQDRIDAIEQARVAAQAQAAEAAKAARVAEEAAQQLQWEIDRRDEEKASARVQALDLQRAMVDRILSHDVEKDTGGDARLLALAMVRMLSESGNLTSHDDVAAMLGVDLDGADQAGSDE